MLQSVKKLLLKNKTLFYIWYYNRARFLISTSKNIIIVHTPGHVGSSTVYKSLLNHQPKLDYLLLDVHSLKRKFDEGSKIPSLSARHVLQEVIVESIEKIKTKKEVKLICVVRDPVSRALSSFFHAFNIWNEGKSLNQIQNISEEFNHVMNMITKGSSESFLSRTIEYQTTWFEKQVQPFFPINIETDLSEKKSNYHIYKKNNISLLVLKLENLDETLEAALNNFIGKKVKLVKTNTHDSRKESNSEFYNYTKKNFKLPIDEIEKIYSSKFVKQFYSEEEIQGFKNLWREN